MRWGWFECDGGTMEAFYPFDATEGTWRIRFTRNNEVIFDDYSVAVTQPPMGPTSKDIQAMDDMVSLLCQEHGINDTEALRK